MLLSWLDCVTRTTFPILRHHRSGDLMMSVSWYGFCRGLLGRLNFTKRECARMSCNRAHLSVSITGYAIRPLRRSTSCCFLILSSFNFNLTRKNSVSDQSLILIPSVQFRSHFTVELKTGNVQSSISLSWFSNEWTNQILSYFSSSFEISVQH